MKEVFPDESTQGTKAVRARATGNCPRFEIGDRVEAELVLIRSRAGARRVIRLNYSNPTGLRI